MGARGVKDVGVKSQGPHGHERPDSLATDEEASEEEDSSLQTPYADRFSCLTRFSRPLGPRLTCHNVQTMSPLNVTKS